MVVGIVGTLVPLVPGLGLAWAAALLYGLAEGFGAAGVAAMVVITVLTAAVRRRVGRPRPGGWQRRGRPAVDPARGGRGGRGVLRHPRRRRDGRRGAGVYLGELLRTSDGGDAWRATWATIKGFGVATLLQFLAAFLMSAAWGAWVAD